ncbi:MAG: hypothetical protein MZV65_00605 [Chromatiales bacterium]|nr:hypothetical protein [Chromatiales bacterium]
MVTGAKVKQYVGEQYPRKTVYLIEPGVSPEFQEPEREPFLAIIRRSDCAADCRKCAAAKGQPHNLERFESDQRPELDLALGESERPDLTNAQSVC